MGCDIHPVLEKKYKFEDGTEKWVGIHSFEFRSCYVAKEVNGKWTPQRDGYNWIPDFDSRNYIRFAKLAGVRGDGPEPKGLPDDMSDLSRMLADHDGSDGHSHSWCTMREALEICLGTEYDSAAVFLDPEDVRKKDPLDYYFGLSYFDQDEDDMDNYRLVFWFDN